MSVHNSAVVIGFDGSDSSEHALQWAADIAAARNLPLAILYASQVGLDPGLDNFPAHEARDQAEHLLQHGQGIAQTTRPDLMVSTEFVQDSPAHALIDASEHAALVVVGHRGHGGFHDMLLGSTSLHTAMHARCPVAVIRPASDPGPNGAGNVGRIVVGVDDGQQSAPALEYAFEQARLAGRPITVVHAWQGPVTMEAPGAMPFVVDLDVQREREERVLHEAIEAWRARYPEVEISAKNIEGPTAAVLVQESMGAHQVVVGSRGLGGFAGLLLGSTGQALIHHAGCPVIIAHRQD
jgi:nucleotide-binding universal stress UspA family protein